MRYYIFTGRLYRWRDWPSCGDPDWERGEHEFHVGLGGDSADVALERLRKSEEDDGCTVLSATLVGEFDPQPGVPSEEDLVEQRLLSWRFSPRWWSTTVLDLIETCKKDPSARPWTYPVLADALMDAGCDNERLLNFCRKSLKPV